MEKVLVTVILGCIGVVFSQIAVVEIRLENLLKMQQGLGWPHNINVTVGHEALLTLASTLEGQQSCTVTTPTGLSFNVGSPPNNRFESWGDGCGVRVRNVAMTDAGRWRLTAARDTESIVGWTEVFVDQATASYTGPEISLQDGHTNTDVLLTTLDNSYCVVAQPFSESSLVPGHCTVHLDRTTRAVQGNWNILLGLPGRVQELHVERHITVQAERLDVGYTHDTATNKLHLYCNIQHTQKNVTFCRFQRTDSNVGYNMADGLSDGSHSYYGDGFPARHCGMTVESPTGQDYSTWRCSVGVRAWVGEHLESQTPMQALISVAQPAGFNAQLQNDESGVRTVFVEEGRSFSVMCRADMALAYCWFLHPNGTQITPAHIDGEDQLFWYTGESLQTGDCGITFSHATASEEGEWICHMGPRDNMGFEIIDTAYVRVSGPLAANQQELAVIVGSEVTLYCHTSNGNRPLEYCRFLSPTFAGINLDESITQEHALLGRYYFTPGRYLDHGECSLTISEIAREDLGIWTCGAVINEDTVESRDTIRVYVGSNLPLSQATLIGMAAGAVMLIVLLVGAVWYGLRKKSSGPAPAPPSQAGSRNDIVPLEVLENPSIGRPSNISSSSESSANESVILNVAHEVRSLASQVTPGPSDAVERMSVASSVRQRPSSAKERESIALSVLSRPRPKSASLSRASSVSTVL